MNIKQLRKICQPERKEPILIALIRKFSIYITWLLTFTPVTANQVTLSMLFFNIMGAIMIAFGDYTYAIIGVGLGIVAYVMDVVDGEVARYRKTNSINGAYLDLLIHRISNPVFIMAIAFHAFSQDNNMLILVLGFVFAHSVVMKNIIFSTKCEIYKRSEELSDEDNLSEETIYLPVHLIQRETQPGKTVSKIRGVRKFYQKFFFFYRYPALLFILSAGIILGISKYLIFFYGALSPLIIAINLYYEYMRGFK